LCGDEADERPPTGRLRIHRPAGGPLAHTFDNTRIASVALESKQDVTQAQQQHDLALMHHDKADEAYRDSEV